MKNNTIIAAAILALAALSTKPSVATTPKPDIISVDTTSIIINDTKYEIREMERTDQLEQLQLEDSLMFRVLHKDTYPAIELLKWRRQITDTDTLFFVVPRAEGDTHIDICCNDDLGKRADEMTFSGYYKVGRYTFVLEKSLCEKFGKLCSPNITVTYSYTWTDLPKQMRAPLVWHLTRSYTGDAYMVIGAPTTMRGEPVRAID